jgi:hypothetical protein
MRIIRNHARAAALVYKRLDVLDALFLSGVMTAGFLAALLLSGWDR